MVASGIIPEKAAKTQSVKGVIVGIHINGDLEVRPRSGPCRAGHIRVPRSLIERKGFIRGDQVAVDIDESRLPKSDKEPFYAITIVKL